MHPKPGDIILSHGPYLISKIIRKVTHSYWNHAGIYIGHGKQIEARKFGVVQSSYVDKGEYTKVISKKLSKVQREKIVEYAKQQIGKKYDYMQLVSLFFIWLFHIGQVKNVKNHFICSELVAEAYTKAGIKLSRKPIVYVTPGDIAREN